MKQATGAVPQTYAMMRLNRWVVWTVWKINQATSDPRPKQVASWWWKLVTVRHMQQFEQGGGGNGKAVPCPVDVMEAEETDRCVAALPPGLRRMIALAYLDNRPVRVKLAMLNEAGTSMSRATYFRYLGRAYDVLLGYFNDVAAGVDLPESKKPVAGAQARPIAATA